jgi:hypothetical protein
MKLYNDRIWASVARMVTRPRVSVSGVIFAILVVVLLSATLSRAWIGDSVVHFGPIGAETCVAEVRLSGPPGPVRCAPEPLATFPTEIIALRWAALLGGITAAMVCGLAALRSWRGTAPPEGSGTILFVIAVVMIAFELTSLLRYENDAILARFYAAISAVIAGAVTVAVARRQRST